jgi:hypothetical protein
MGWQATERYELPQAPGGLGFVQDFLNTQPTAHPPMPDLLADLQDAQSWLDGALDRWSNDTGVYQARVVLGTDELAKMRDLRAELTALVHAAGNTGATFPSAAITGSVGPDGDVVLAPRGEGNRRVGAILLIEMFSAQRLNTWRRLKVCRNARCGVSFYDRSRNNSGVWHDAKVCGNAINLRASRARKRRREPRSETE